MFRSRLDLRTTAREATERLATLLRQEQVALGDFLVALAEFDDARGWAELGHGSLVTFLTRELKLSKSAAYYRQVAARLIRTAPEVIEPLRDGRLCVTAVVELAKVMTPENRREVLPRFFHASKQEARGRGADRAGCGPTAPRTTSRRPSGSGRSWAHATASGRAVITFDDPRAAVRHPDAIPAAVRRAVWERDQGRCQWKLEDGGVCGATARLEIDHVYPHALGGASTVANTRVLCHFHNQLAARRAFGDEWMDWFIAARAGNGGRPRARRAAVQQAPTSAGSGAG